MTELKHEDELREWIDRLAISENDFCLIGSAALARRGLRENSDIDILPSKECRDAIEARISENVIESRKGDRGIALSEHVDVAKEGRFKPVDLEDDAVVYDERYHERWNGIKIVRLELEIAIKDIKRREKDKRDIELIENEVVLDPNEVWDWDLMPVPIPWHVDSSQKRKSQIREQLQEGNYAKLVRDLFERGFHRIGNRVLSNPIYDLNQFYYRGWMPKALDVKRGLLLFPITNDIEIHYPLANLIGRQYKNGQFCRYDLVASYAGLGERFDTDLMDGPPAINRSGRIVQGIDEIGSAARDDKWSVEVGIDPKKVDPVTRDDARQIFDDDEFEEIERARDELFRTTGYLFQAIIWPSAAEIADGVVEFLDREGVVYNMYSTEIDGEMREFVRHLYETDHRSQDWKIEKKIREIERFGNEIRVVEMEIRNPKLSRTTRVPVSNYALDLKDRVRQRFYTEIDYTYDNLIHMTDNYEQNKHVVQTLTKYHKKNHV